MTFDLEMILRLCLAAVLGGVIGVEREQSYRGAGLRTHALVATAAALAIIVSAHGFDEVIMPGRIVLDPSRVAAQVITGIGFLGAGIIIFRKNAVRGLTTAASVWAVASVGLAAGAGLYTIAIGATAVFAFILIGIKKIEKKFFTEKHINAFTIQLKPIAVRAVSDHLKRIGLKIINMNMQTSRLGETVIKVEVLAGEQAIVSLYEDLQATADVETVSYIGKILPVSETENMDL